MLALIWAQAHNRVIGNAGDMPWYVPEDLAHFKELTRGHPVIMGRRTWDSLQVRPLPGRLNIVISHRDLKLPDGAVQARSVEHAREIAHSTANELIWGIGGATLYEELLPLATRLEITELDLDVEGDTFAPEIGPEFSRVEGDWQVSREGTRYRFVSLSK